MLEFKNDELFILPFSKLIRVFISLNGLDIVYSNKFDNESYMVYHICHNLIEKIRESRFNIDADHNELFDQILEPYFESVYFSKERYTEHFRNVLFRNYMMDVTDLGLILNDLRLTELSVPLDIFKITYENIYVTVIMLEHKPT